MYVVLSLKLEKCKEKETIQISKLFIHFPENFKYAKYTSKLVFPKPKKSA
jgi:hypothetical protein